MEELKTQKEKVATLVKALPVEKVQIIKKAVAKKLAKSFEGKEVSNEKASLIAVDVLLKALQAGYDSFVAAPPAPGSESEKVAQAAGVQVIQDPTQTKEVKFSNGLFQNFQLGSVIINSPEGAALVNTRKPVMDYVSAAGKTANKTYSAEELKQELEQKQEAPKKG
jgi:hypothetical protein